MTQQLILLCVFNQESSHKRQRSQKSHLRLESTMEELGNKRIKKVLSGLFSCFPNVQSLEKQLNSKVPVKRSTINIFVSNRELVHSLLEIPV